MIQVRFKLPWAYQPDCHLPSIQQQKISTSALKRQAEFAQIGHWTRFG